jgi:hypothetical protein
MPFELIMLLGLLGTGLRSLLPAAPADAAEEGVREPDRFRRSDRGMQPSRRHGRRPGVVTARSNPPHKRGTARSRA